MALDEKILERLRARDSEAWEQVLAALRPRIWGIVCRYAKKPDDRLDLFAEARGSLTSSILGTDGVASGIRSPEALEGWAVRLTKWRCADWKRKEEGRPDKTALPTEVASAVVDGTAVLPSDSLTDSDHGVIVAWLLELESRFQQEAIWLRCAEGSSCAEIARQLGRSAAAVRQAIFKGLRAIRARHDKEGRRLL